MNAFNQITFMINRYKTNEKLHISLELLEFTPTERYDPNFVGFYSQNIQRK